MSFSEISIYERSSNVSPDSKVVLIFDPLPSLRVIVLFIALGVPPLTGVIGLPLLLLDTLETYDLFIPDTDLIVASSFSKFI